MMHDKKLQIKNNTLLTQLLTSKKSHTVFWGNQLAVVARVRDVLTAGPTNQMTEDEGDSNERPS